MKHYYVAGNRFLTHLLFWMAYLLVNTGVHLNAREPMAVYFLYELQALPTAMLVAYGNMYFLYPRFFKRKQYIAYSMVSVILLFAVALLSRVITERIFEPLVLPDTTTPEAIFVWYMLFKGMLWFLGPLLLFTLVVKVTEQWFSTEQVRQEAVREKLNAELEFLKAQVHPHFLFNTLNNLYALTLEASPMAPEVVLKLSALMSYMLYDSRSPLLNLDQEIEHIKNYIELEKLRYGQRLEVSFTVSGPTQDYTLAPLLLIPLVENAFKHGTGNEMGKVWVTIDIKAKENQVQMSVENSSSASAKRDLEGHSGMGLQNVRRRLDLLYAADYRLDLQQEPDRYLAHLKIKTAG